jgi:predicted GNAT superfamily acetyltransferase
VVEGQVVVAAGRRRGDRRGAVPLDGMQALTCAEVTDVMGGRLGGMESPEVLRPMTDDHVTAVLRLNEDHVELLAPMDGDRLASLRQWASRSDVIVCDDEIAGFVLVFGPGTDYDSENYRWFTERFGDRFDYLDRIVIDDRFRRRGLASAVYDEIESAAASRERLVLEVNIEPPNEPSLAFHRRRGFVEVGQLGPAGHRVSLMAKSSPPKARDDS